VVVGSYSGLGGGYGGFRLLKKVVMGDGGGA
jgi:hypothetical protein